MKLTVKLSKPLKPIIELIKQGHNLTGPIRNWNNIEGAALYYGTSHAGPPTWIGFLEMGTDADFTRLRNEGALALLFIPIEDRHMLISFGYGHPKLSATGWEKDFGLKVVLNTIDPRKVKSLDAKTVDTVVMLRKVQLSKENKINDFGFEIDRDFLKNIAGKSSDENFAKMMSGGENLTINCDIDVPTFNEKVQEIYDRYNSVAYQEHYAWIDNIKAVDDNTLIETLNARLLDDFNLLLAGDEANLDTACPDIVDYDFTSYYKVKGYRDSEQKDYISIDAIIESLKSKGIDTITSENLFSYKIESFDGNDNSTASWPLYYWLVYEHELGGSMYILSEGEWYFIHTDYFGRINTDYTRIMRSPNEYTSLGVTTYQTERDYIDNYNVTSDDFIFDSMLSYIYGGRDSIEICDIYNVQREFIHIKDGGSSSKLSHLFNQGYVSASMFLSDVLYRDDIVKKLRDNRKVRLARTINNNPVAGNYTIVYRVLKGGRQLTLPFFTKVVIVDMYRRIKSMGYKFRLEWLQKQ